MLDEPTPFDELIDQIQAIGNGYCPVSDKFLQQAHLPTDTAYRHLPIKEIEGFLHNDFIDNAIAPIASTTESQAMNNDQMLMEIRETNLSYLMLAQSLIRSDRDQALFRLGLSEEAADRIASLSPAQVLKIASSNILICRMRVDDDLVWTLLTNHGKSTSNDSVSQLHASILMAGKHQEAV